MQFSEGISEVQLKLIEVNLTEMISGYLDYPEAHVAVHWLTKDVEARIRGFLIEQNLSRTKAYEFHYPTTWWDHFVTTHEELFPKWYLKKWPANHTKVTHTVDCSAVYPDFEMPTSRPFTNKLYVIKDSTRYSSLDKYFDPNADPTSVATDKFYRATPRLEPPCPHKYDLRMFMPSDIKSNFNWGSTENWVCRACGANYRDVIR